MRIPIGFAQINYHFTGEGAPTGADITIGVQTGFGPTAEEVAEDAATAWGTADMAALYVDALTMSKVTVKMGPNATGEFHERSVDFPGTGTGAAVPPNTAALIRKNTALGGRKGRGRLYFPGIPEASVDSGGELLEVLRAGFDTRWEDWSTFMIAAGWVPVLLHGDETTPTPLTALSCSVTSATQRRRLRR